MAERSPLRVLWVATKAPWPPRDGGRLLQLETLRLLAERGGDDEQAVEVDLVAPAPRHEHAPIEAALSPWCRPHLVAARPLPLPLAVLRAAVRRQPVTAARHALAAVARRVAEVAARGSFDVVHAEQVQAMPQALHAHQPVVLRAQNVESQLWRGTAGGGDAATVTVGGRSPSVEDRSHGFERTPSLLSAVLRREGERLARWEGATLRRAALTIALTERDAAALGALAPGTRVEVLPVPFPDGLPSGPPLHGAPAVTLLVGAGWQPNRDGAEAFIARSWPLVRRALPEARLHVFGEVLAAGDGIVAHDVPSDSSSVFAAGSILVVPLAVASGVRMKVLEAWARGVPVAATPAAAAGLEATDGKELLIGEGGEALAAAVVRLAGDVALQRDVVTAGRALLRRRHAPAALRRRLLAHYAAAARAAPR